MSLVERELTVIVTAHLLAVIPIGVSALASRMSPLYEVPSAQLARWWAWFALIIVASAVVVSSVT